MKVLIDIPEKLYTETKDFKNPFPSDLAYNLRMPVANGIVLDNLTNGEVVQMMCPNCEVKTGGIFAEVRYIDSYCDRDVTKFYLSWWNRKWGE